jgi:nicotinamidase-related amidase
MKTHLIVIDPQRDFCDPEGSLYVPGAENDMRRLAGFVRRLRTKLTNIHVTLDSHHVMDISHPRWWKDFSGKHPDPFTIITVQDLKWTTTRPGMFKRSLAYLEALEAGGRYPHVIWPEHCLIGDKGHTVVPALAEAIHEWEREQFAQTDYITKGSNPWTEHFSGVKAEVPDPEDPNTQVNTGFIQTLEDADVILLAGEALSHCLLSTIEDIVAAFSDPAHVSKLVLLEDATSAIPDPPGTTLFSDKVAKFLQEMQAKGMRISTTEEFLA